VREPPNVGGTRDVGYPPAKGGETLLLSAERGGLPERSPPKGEKGGCGTPGGKKKKGASFGGKPPKIIITGGKEIFSPRN